MLKLMPRIGYLVTPVSQLSVCKEDEDDNRILECADAVAADYLITGNTKHFPPEWKTTKIVKPRTFIDQWRKRGGINRANKTEHTGAKHGRGVSTSPARELAYDLPGSASIIDCRSRSSPPSGSA
jgi:hypothetical protein